MATGKRLKAAILARVAKGPRKKRTRPEPRQYTVADLERARDRVAAAERRIDNDRSRNLDEGRAGLKRAQLELSVIVATPLARPPSAMNPMSGRSREKFRGCSNVRYWVRSGHFADLLQCPLMMLWTAPALRHRSAIVVALKARVAKEVKPLPTWKLEL
jgi:hypothetical protein